MYLRVYVTLVITLMNLSGIIDTDIVLEMSGINASIEFWLLGVLLPVIIFLGVIGNITVIVMFHLGKMCKSKTLSGLIVTQAITDLMFLVRIGNCLSCG